MLKTSYIPDRPAAWWQVWVVPLIAVGGAWIARYGLQPILGAAAPYLFFVGAVLVATWWGGWGGGLLATLAGGIVANLSFVGLPDSFEVHGVELRDLLVFAAFGGALASVEEVLISGIRREMLLNEELTLVGQELRHRIKNLLSVAEALSHQTGRSVSTVEEFDQKLVGRLRALVSAQDLLASDAGRRVSLSMVLTAAVTPFLSEERLARPITGPEVQIDRELVVPLALILNELATNSVKYGALSVPAGAVELSWTRSGDWAAIAWAERAGPPVLPPSRDGFGLRLLRSALPKSRGGVRLFFDPSGLRCEITLAVAHPSGALAGQSRKFDRLVS